jgi:hypothetical protein
MTMKKQLKRITDYRTWLRGMIGAIIGGGANGVTVMVIKPEDFNLQTGWPALWQFTLISALISLALYLKTSPVPPQEIVEATRAPFPTTPPSTP